MKDTYNLLIMLTFISLGVIRHFLFGTNIQASLQKPTVKSGLGNVSLGRNAWMPLAT
jgi:hypothetical protein